MTGHNKFAILEQARRTVPDVFPFMPFPYRQLRVAVEKAMKTDPFLSRVYPGGPGSPFLLF